MILIDIHIFLRNTACLEAINFSLLLSAEVSNFYSQIATPVVIIGLTNDFEKLKVLYCGMSLQKKIINHFDFVAWWRERGAKICSCCPICVEDA